MTTRPMSLRPGSSNIVWKEDLLEDGAETARAGAPEDRLVGDRRESVLGELEFDVLELEDLLVLLHQGVLRLGEDLSRGRRGRGC